MAHKLSLKIVIENEEDVRRFAEAHNRVQELIEEYPWIDDLREIDQLLQQAGKSLCGTRSR